MPVPGRGLAAPQAEAPRLASRAGPGGRGAALALALGPGLAAGPGRALAAACTSTTRGCCSPSTRSAFVRAARLAALAWRAARCWCGLPSRGAGRPGPPRWRARRGRRGWALAAAAGLPRRHARTRLVRPRAFLSDLAFNHQTRFEYKGLAGAATSFGPYLAPAGRRAHRAAAGRGRRRQRGRAPRGRARRRAAAVVACGAPLAPYLLVASSGHQAMRFLAPALPAVRLAGRPGPAQRCRASARAAAAAALVLARARPGRRAGRAAVLRGLARAGRALARGQRARRGDAWTSSPTTPATRPRCPAGRTCAWCRPSRARWRPPERFAEAAAALPARGRRAGWSSPPPTTSASSTIPSSAPERAAFFRDLLEGRGGFEVAARFRQEGWRRPPAEFLDPEIVILRKTELS